MPKNAFINDIAERVEISTIKEIVYVDLEIYMENYPQITMVAPAVTAGGILTTNGTGYATFDDSSLFNEEEQNFVVMTATKFDSIGATEQFVISSYETPSPFDIYAIRVTSTGVRYFLRGAAVVNDYTYPTTISTGAWYHFAIVVDQSTNVARCYFNGALVNTFSPENMPTYVGAKLVLGGAINLSGAHSIVQGQTKMTQVYKGFLTDAEIAAEAAKR